jgi:hypothetical protein
VNPNPTPPDKIIDAQFGRTEAGRILLEADLQLKRTTARLVNPATPMGSRYWPTLIERGAAVLQRQRLWIVPAPATVSERDGAVSSLASSVLSSAASAR